MSLSSLPVELLDRITFVLQRDLKDDRDLFALDEGIDCGHPLLKPLASVNTQLRAVVAPALFSQVVIIGMATDESPRVHHLHRLLSMRPHIASLLKYVHSYYSSDRSSYLLSIILGSSNSAKLMNILRRYSEGQEGEYHGSIPWRLF